MKMRAKNTAGDRWQKIINSTSSWSSSHVWFERMIEMEGATLCYVRGSFRHGIIERDVQPELSSGSKATVDASGGKLSVSPVLQRKGSRWWSVGSDGNWPSSRRPWLSTRTVLGSRRHSSSSSSSSSGSFALSNNCDVLGKHKRPARGSLSDSLWHRRGESLSAWYLEQKHWQSSDG